MASEITLEQVQDALREISPFIHRTPVITSSTIDEASGLHVLMKCENFQRVGAFKIRGATNAIRSLLTSKTGATTLPEDITVVTHSSGNHAQALALAARNQGVRCHVVMPNNAPSVKKEAVAGYGAAITFCEPNLKAREATARRVIQEEASRDGRPRLVEFIPPYNDERVIIGQGTIAIELIEQASKELDKALDVLVTPVGGGGMLSGCALTAKGLDPNIKVIGAEPAGAADACRSFYSRTLYESIDPKTIADGLLTSLGSLTFPLILKYVDEIFTVTEEQIIRALKLAYERLKIVIEPSAAVPLAVILYSAGFKEYSRRLAKEKGHRLSVGIVLSGGNVELTRVLRLFESIE